MIRTRDWLPGNPDRKKLISRMVGDNIVDRGLTDIPVPNGNRAERRAAAKARKRRGR